MKYNTFIGTLIFLRLIKISFFVFKRRIEYTIPLNINQFRSSIFGTQKEDFGLWTCFEDWTFLLFERHF